MNVVLWNDSQIIFSNELSEQSFGSVLLDCVASPVWMDSSTAQQCKEIEDAVGGPLELAHLTGSRYEYRVIQVYVTTDDSVSSDCSCSRTLSTYRCCCDAVLVAEIGFKECVLYSALQMADSQ